MYNEGKQQTKDNRKIWRAPKEGTLTPQGKRRHNTYRMAVYSSISNRQSRALAGRGGPAEPSFPLHQSQGNFDSQPYTHEPGVGGQGEHVGTRRKKQNAAAGCTGANTGIVQQILKCNG